VLYVAKEKTSTAQEDSILQPICKKAKKLERVKLPCKGSVALPQYRAGGWPHCQHRTQKLLGQRRWSARLAETSWNSACLAVFVNLTHKITTQSSSIIIISGNSSVSRQAQTSLRFQKTILVSQLLSWYLTSFSILSMKHLFPKSCFKFHLFRFHKLRVPQSSVPVSELPNT